MHTNYLTDHFGLPGRTALVTGAGRGLGRSIAHALASAGARVVLADIAPEVDATAAAFTAAGLAVRSAQVDVTDRAAVLALADTLAAGGWSPDILVNNAGVQHRCPFNDFPPEAWERVLAVHLSGAVHLTQAFAPGMQAGGFGRVIMMSSVAAQASIANIAAYSAAKGALAALTRTLAVEFGPHGVTCNALAPGFFRTDFTRALQDDPDFRSRLAEAVPLARWGEPDELGPVVVFLCSAAANFINGHILTVDGGMMAKS